MSLIRASLEILNEVSFLFPIFCFSFSRSLGSLDEHCLIDKILINRGFHCSCSLMSDNEVLSAIKALQNPSQKPIIGYQLYSSRIHILCQLQIAMSTKQIASSSKQHTLSENQDPVQTACFVKMEVPKFNGTDPFGQIYCIEEFFDFHSTQRPLNFESCLSTWRVKLRLGFSG